MKTKPASILWLRILALWLPVLGLVQVGIGQTDLQLTTKDHNTSSNQRPQAISPFQSLVQFIADPRQRIGDRINAVHGLGNDLTKEDIFALNSFLKSLPDSKENNLAGLRVIKNDILNRLAMQSVTPPDFIPLLIGIYHDTAQDSVIRDYAIQHLATLSEHAAGIDKRSRKLICETLVSAASQNDGIVGTALLALHRLSAHDRSISAQWIDKTASRLAISSGTERGARITAIQICGERKLIKVQAALIALARSSSSQTLRISAIAALGRMGGLESQVLLRQLRSDPNPSIHAAASSALRRLEAGLAETESF